MGRTWTSAEVCELVTRFPAEGAAGLAMTLGRSADSVCSQAHRYGIRSQTRRVRQGRSRAIGNRTVNIRFFEESGPAVAYVLGFTWACGRVKTRHRNVLHISCDCDRRDKLDRVLSLMDSKHQIQDQYGNTAVIEICNSHLVRQLLQNFGRPPGRSSPDPSLPDLPAELVPHFAWGHLDATGRETPTSIYWTGTPRVMNQLIQFVQAAANSEPSSRHQIYGKTNVAWTGRKRVHRIQNWLNRGRGAITADPR